MKKEFIMPSMEIKGFDRIEILADSIVTPTNTQAAKNYAIENAGLTAGTGSDDERSVSIAEIVITDW